MRSLAGPLLSIVLCGPAAADIPSWQEANQQSAQALKERNYPKAARLAQTAFDRYGTMAAGYDVKAHAQLLLNAVDARLQAEGPAAAVDVLRRGADAIASRDRAPQPVLVSIYEECVNISRAANLYAAGGECYEDAAELADRVFGEQDPRAILLHSRWATGQFRDYPWALAKLRKARARAAAAGLAASFLAALDMRIARLHLVHHRWDSAIETYEALVPLLETSRDETDRALLQTVYAYLMYAQENAKQPEAAERTRQSIIRTFGGGGQLKPLLRVQPSWPPGITTDGHVVLELRISGDGTVSSVEVLESSDPVFEAPTLAAVRQWKYAPVVIEGKPIKQKGIQRIDFRMK